MAPNDVLQRDLDDIRTDARALQRSSDAMGEISGKIFPLLDASWGFGKLGEDIGLDVYYSDYTMSMIGYANQGKEVFAEMSAALRKVADVYAENERHISKDLQDIRAAWSG